MDTNQASAVEEVRDALRNNLSPEQFRQRVMQKGLFSEYGNACYIGSNGKKIRHCNAYEHTTPRFLHHARQERRPAALLEAIELAMKKKADATEPPEYPNKLM